MNERKGVRLLVVVAVWLALLVGVGAAYRYGLSPYLTRRAQARQLTAEYASLRQEAARRGVVTEPAPNSADPATLAALVDDLKLRLTAAGATVAGGGKPAAPSRVALALDSFSGYAVFRSELFKRLLAAQGVQLDLVDDGADYAKRLRSVATGQTPLAVFTVDALIKASADAGALPATIVLAIDESAGADAMVAYAATFPNIDALNRSDARIVATRSSPSETLARVVMGSFDLQKLGRDPFVPATSAEDVYRKMTQAPAGEPSVFVLWEPFVSRALKIPGTHVLIDSSRFRGYIADVLVAQRDYLLEHEDRVRTFVETYLRAAHELGRRPGGMAELVRADAAAQGDPLSAEQAAKLAKGIRWKNTTENFASFGATAGGGGPTLAQMIGNITQVLLATGGIQRDPADGNPGRLFYDRIVRALSDAAFHPGHATGTEEATTPAAQVAALAPEQWDALVPVGTLQVERIVFARGTSDLTDQSRRALARLAETLQAFPSYYVMVRGNARADGDAEANKRLAERRAAAAADFLLQAGIPAARVRAIGAAPAGAGGESQSVTFVLGQIAY